jgi:saccharopine dehydrogenase-like NADP-dependent oxidoreductase
MAQLTGIPLAIGARMLARGAIDATGVVAPEACVPPDEFLAQLGQRGIVTYEMGIDHPLEAVPAAVAS